MAVAGTTWRCAGLVGLVGAAVCLPPASHAAESKAAAETARFRAMIESAILDVVADVGSSGLGLRS